MACPALGFAPRGGRRRRRAAVFEETARVHAALGQNAEHRLPFPFEGRLLQGFEAVVTEDAPAEHSVLALEESESVAGGPVERAVGVCDFRRVKALAREARLHRANQQRRRGHLLILLERGFVGGAQARRIEHRRRVDALLGHVLLEAPLEREKQARVALRFAVDEVRQDSTVLSERRLRDRPDAIVFAHLFAEAPPQEREGGRDAVELEVAVLRPRTVVVVRIPPSQGQVGRAGYDCGTICSSGFERSVKMYGVQSSPRSSTTIRGSWGRARSISPAGWPSFQSGTGCNGDGCADADDCATASASCRPPSVAVSRRLAVCAPAHAVVESTQKSAGSHRSGRGRGAIDAAYHRGRSACRTGSRTSRSPE